MKKYSVTRKGPVFKIYLSKSTKVLASKYTQCTKSKSTHCAKMFSSIK